MMRFAASLITIASLSLPVLVYQDDARRADVDQGWYDHTYTARSLAERIARHAALTLPPAEDLEDFARATRDNPAQAAKVAAMRAAVASKDAARLFRLAEAAIAEEDQLLPARRTRDRAQREVVRQRVALIWAGGAVASVLQAFQAWHVRRSLRKAIAELDLAEDDLSQLRKAVGS